jgi:hypothetical protein
MDEYTMNWILVFAVANFYGMIIDKLGPMIMFGIFGGMCILGSLIIASIAPETTGKTREGLNWN